MIKDILSPHLNKVATPLILPVAESTLQQHVDGNAILFKVVDEELWITQDLSEELFESLSYMIGLGAKQSQMYLVLVLAEGGRGRTYDILRYWQRSGGSGIAIYEHELEQFFRNEGDAIEGK